MKYFFLLMLLMTTFVANSQNTQAVPNDGFEIFVNQIFTQIPIPNELYESKETVLRISVDSVGTAKLLMVKPYNKDFFQDVQKFVAESKWTAATENGLAKKSMIQLPLIFEREVNSIQDEEASPKSDMMAFYQYFTRKLNLKKYKTNTLICDAKFKVLEDGSLELISISENDVKLYNDLKELFANAEKWNPTIKDGKPVSSVKNFKLTIKK